MKVRDLIFYTDKEKAYIKGQVEESLNACIKAWNSDSVIIVKDVEQADTGRFNVNIYSYMFTSQSNSECCLLSITEDDIRPLLAVLMEANSAVKVTDITKKLTDNFFVDLVNSCCKDVELLSTNVDSEMYKDIFYDGNNKIIGFGNLVIGFTINEVKFNMLVNSYIVSKLITGYKNDDVKSISEYSLAKYSELLGDKTVRLEVQIGALDLSVSALGNLHKDDVIHLDKKLNETISLKFIDSAVECKGYPVQCESMKSLRLIA